MAPLALARRSLERPAIPALIVAIVGSLSLALYWLALPAPFVGSAAFLALEARERAARGDDAGGGRGTAASVVAAATLVAAVLLSIFGE